MNEYLSLITGLEEHDCGCIERDGEVKKITSEQARAARSHRWKEFNELAVAYLIEIDSVIRKFEKRILNELDLPDYDEVVEAYVSEETAKTAQTWTFSEKRQTAYKAIIKDFLDYLTGERSLKSATLSTDVMPFSSSLPMDSFGMAAKKYKSVYKKRLPRNIDPEFIDQIIINTNRDNPRIDKLVKGVTKRIRKKVLKENYKDMVKKLIEKSTPRGDPMDAAKLLHRWWGGDLAYWDRLIKSEMSLAANEAYKEWSQKSAVLYNVWHAMPGCCPICDFFDGNKWLVNENPWPVTDTHPRCQCVIEPSWEIKEGESIRDRWDRITPYESPMSKDELEAWRRWYGD